MNSQQKRIIASVIIRVADRALDKRKTCVRGLRMSLNALRMAEDEGEAVWRTIGAKTSTTTPTGRKRKTPKKTGGVRVQIKDGRIVKGPSKMVGNSPKKPLEKLPKPVDNRNADATIEAEAGKSTTKGAGGNPMKIDAKTIEYKGEYSFEHDDIMDGQEVEVRDSSRSKTIRGVARKVSDKDEFSIENPIVEEDELPEVKSGVLKLPNLRGHAHQRSWDRGDIVEVRGEIYRVSHNPKYNTKTGKMEYKLSPATESQKAKRPGRSLLKVSSDQAPHQVGRAVKIGDEWLEIKGIVRSPYTSGEGDVFGYHYYGKGNFIPESRAKKLNKSWDAKKKVRDLELELSVATGPESVHTSEGIRKIREELESAKEKIPN